MTASAVQSIQFLVANSVEGLRANSVTVVDNRATYSRTILKAIRSTGITARSTRGAAQCRAVPVPKSTGDAGKSARPGTGRSARRGGGQHRNHQSNRKPGIPKADRPPIQHHRGRSGAPRRPTQVEEVAGVTANASTETNAAAVAANTTAQEENHQQPSH